MSTDKKLLLTIDIKDPNAKRPTKISLTKVPTGYIVSTITYGGQCGVSSVCTVMIYADEYVDFKDRRVSANPFNNHKSVWNKLDLGDLKKIWRGFNQHEKSLFTIIWHYHLQKNIRSVSDDYKCIVTFMLMDMIIYSQTRLCADVLREDDTMWSGIRATCKMY